MNTIITILYAMVNALYASMNGVAIIGADACESTHLLATALHSFIGYNKIPTATLNKVPHFDTVSNFEHTVATHSSEECDDPVLNSLLYGMKMGVTEGMTVIGQSLAESVGQLLMAYDSYCATQDVYQYCMWWYDREMLIEAQHIANPYFKSIK